MKFSHELSLKLAVVALKLLERYYMLTVDWCDAAVYCILLASQVTLAPPGRLEQLLKHRVLCVCVFCCCFFQLSVFVFFCRIVAHCRHNDAADARRQQSSWAQQRC